MQIFYAPGISGSIHYLDENESRHCIRVLRMQKGEAVRLVDGKGTLFEGWISDPDQRRCGIELTEKIADFEKRDYRLHIAISPLKNQERFEWFVEKSVEAGIDEITPLICRNTEKQGIKAERIENIIISAVKQSIKAYKPVLNKPVLFDEFIRTVVDETRMIAHCSNDFGRSSIDKVCRKGEDAVILIGPEGDFSKEEIAAALENGFRPVHLGRSRLRSETAGMAACLAIYFINQ
jgi:16S rRNA (uracil1498-N3)-methyltransferase